MLRRGAKAEIHFYIEELCCIIITLSSYESSMGSKPILAAQFRITVHAPSEYTSVSNFGTKLIGQKYGWCAIARRAHHCLPETRMLANKFGELALRHRDNKCTEYTDSHFETYSQCDVDVVDGGSRYRLRYRCCSCWVFSLIATEWNEGGNENACQSKQYIYIHYETEWRDAQTTVD